MLNLVVIITRSKARANPAQYTPMPFIVKCLKLILTELQTYKTTAGGKGKKVSNNTIDLEEDDGVSPFSYQTLSIALSADHRFMCAVMCGWFSGVQG